MGKNNKKEPSRRDFLKYGKAILGLTLVGGASGIAYHFATKGSPWDFVTVPVNADGFFEEHRDSKNSKYYVPLDQEKYLRKHEEELITAIQNLTPTIIKINRSKGWNDRDVSLLVKNQLYGRADNNPRYSKEYEKYIKTAVDFLYERIPNLDQLDLDFRILNPGDDYSKNPKGKAFIGVTNHSKQTVIVTHKVTKESFQLPHYNVKEGSVASLNFDSATGEFFYWILFGRGRIAITSPFSEVIPLATYKTFKKHSDKVGMERAIIVSETASEAPAYLLSHEISEKLKIPTVKGIIEQNLEKMLKIDPRYAHVKKAIKWMEKNTVRRGMDLYREDPEKFMQEINKS
jgi:hypothetical protein